MRRSYAVVVLVLVAAVADPGISPAAADEVVGDPLKLEALIGYAREHNPEIRAAAARVQAAEAKPAQAGALPDPMLEFAYHDEGFDRLRLGDTDFAFLRFGASQELPFPGKLGLKREAAAYDVDEAREDARRVELDVIARLKTAYAEYAHVDEVLDLVRRNKDLLDKIARSAEAKYSAGEGIQQDVLNAHVQLSLLLDRETKLDQERQSRAAALNALIDRPPWESLGKAEHPVVQSLTQTLEGLTATAHEHAPLLKMADSRVAGSKSSVALARRELLPDFVVSGEYMHKSALLPEWEVGLGIKLPLYFATKQRSGIAEARATLSQAEATRDDVRRSLDFQVKDLYLRARASERLISLYSSTVLPQARLSLESATSAYQVGKVDFLTLLNSFTVMLEYEMRYHEELANFQKAIAELEATIGEPLNEVVQ